MRPRLLRWDGRSRSQEGGPGCCREEESSWSSRTGRGPRREEESRGRGRAVLLEIPEAGAPLGPPLPVSVQGRFGVIAQRQRSDQLGDCPRDSPLDSHLSFQTSELPLRGKRKKGSAEIGCGAERVGTLTRGRRELKNWRTGELGNQTSPRAHPRLRN